MARELEPYQNIERSIIKKFRKEIWRPFIEAVQRYELVNEGLHTKLEHMPEESRTKLSETLERIINEGSGGLICIIL